MKRTRTFQPASTIRQRRLAVALTVEALAREAGFSTSKTLRVERRPERARVADVALLDETLKRLERAAAGGSGYEGALLSGIRAER